MSKSLGEELDDSIDDLELKMELLMDYLGLEFTYPSAYWDDEPDGVIKVREIGHPSIRSKNDGA